MYNYHGLQTWILNACYIVTGSLFGSHTYSIYQQHGTTTNQIINLKKYSRIRHYEKCQLFHEHTQQCLSFSVNIAHAFLCDNQLHNILPMNTYFYMSVFQHLIIIIMHLHLLKSVLQIAGTSVNLEKCPFQYTATVCVYEFVYHYFSHSHADFATSNQTDLFLFFPLSLSIWMCMLCLVTQNAGVLFIFSCCLFFRSYFIQFGMTLSNYTG